MFNLIQRSAWHIPEREITPEAVFLNRRDFLRRMGFSGAGLWASLGAGAGSGGLAGVVLGAEGGGGGGKYPAKRNPDFSPDWRLTDEKVAANYINFYEFTTVKTRVTAMMDKFVTTPWPIEISGLVEKPMTLDARELVEMMPLEERVYRFRCVEAWAMIVPWTGFPLSKLIEKAQPKPEAKFVRFETFNRPDQAPGMRGNDYPWPYTEGLRMEEAMHPLTLVATGIYGKPLPKQHGAPVRMVIPWKYGYKSIKSVVKIEFTEKQPATLWETLAPHEYPFESNVNPAVPHPRWSQATERMIDTGYRVKTLPYNGYGDLVAKMYRAG